MEIAIARAAHLHVYLDELREIGVPVERALESSRLPAWIEATPDAYVSIPLCFEWVARCSRDIELMDLGFRASRRGSLASLSAAAPACGPRRADRFRPDAGAVRLAALDDSVLAPRMQPEGDRVRVICDLEGLGGNPFVCLGEWLSLQAMISIVRSVAGPRWCPPELTFVARQPPSAAAREAFGNTRFLVGQPHTSMLVESEVLARPSPAGGAPERSGRPRVGGRRGCRLELPVGAPVGDPAVPLGRPSRAAADGGDAGVERTNPAAPPPAVRPDLFRGRPGGALRSRAGDARRPFDEGHRRRHGRRLRAPQHFARAFRQLAGVSPTIYRRSATATA